MTNVTDPEEIARLRASAPDVKESMEIGQETGPFVRSRRSRDGMY